MTGLRHLRCAILALGLLCGPALAKGPLPTQTDVDRARSVVDEKGIPALEIAGVGTFHNPAGVAVYALGYAGEAVYDPSLVLERSPERFRAAVGWLAEHLAPGPGGDPVWLYLFDNAYNDVEIKAPWWSAFAQATGIQALLASYRADGNLEHLRLAEAAARVLVRPVEQGGLLFRRGQDVWFEEVPAPTANPPHILNGHMRALLALDELAQATGDPAWHDWFRRGAETLERWLPLYDAGYWLRYDLNPRTSDLLFRLAAPVGADNPPLAVSRVALRDPVSGSEVSIDVGAEGDAQGDGRIAGTHWGQPEVVEERTVRRLVPVRVEASPEPPADPMVAPHAYFYLSLPGGWTDNLRSASYALEVEYLDEGTGAVAVQLRSIAPGPAFRDLAGGGLAQTGGRAWRTHTAALRVGDLGYWVGQSYAGKHAAYLQRLAESVPSLAAWAATATRYERHETAAGRETARR